MVFRSSELLASAHAATQSSDDSTEFRNNLLEAIASLTEFDTELMNCTTSGLHAERILTNFRTIRVCNIYRTLRIIVNESLLQCTKTLPRARLDINACQVRQERSLRIIEEMRDQSLQLYLRALEPMETFIGKSQVQQRVLGGPIYSYGL